MTPEWKSREFTNVIESLQRDRVERAIAGVVEEWAALGREISERPAVSRQCVQNFPASGKLLRDANTTHASRLSASWMTLYELTKRG